MPQTGDETATQEPATNEWPSISPDDQSVGKKAGDSGLLAPVDSESLAKNPPVKNLSGSATNTMTALVSLQTIRLCLGAGLLVWLAGVVVVSIRFARGWFGLSEIVRNSRPVTDRRHLGVFRNAVTKSGLALDPLFLTSDDFASLMMNRRQAESPVGYYIEFTLAEDSVRSRFREFAVSRWEKIKEEGDATFFNIDAESGVQVVFEGKRVTLASKNFRYDPKNLPAMTAQTGKLLRENERSAGYAVLDAKAGRLIESVIRSGKENLPPLAAPYLEMLGKVDWATVSLELQGRSASITLRAECITSGDADQLGEMVGELVSMAQVSNQALGPQGEMTDKLLKSVKTKVTGRRVETSLTFSEEAVEQSRMAAAESQLMNNHKQTVLSLHNFADANRNFPFRALPGESDNLSWRVRVLPHIEAKNLYDRFDMTKPWDSPENLAMLKEMPAVFGEGNTTNLCWIQSDIQEFGDITNGLGNTIAFVHSSKSVNWTENNDVTPIEVMAQFRSLKPGEYMIATMYDGSVRKIPAETDQVEFETMLFPKKQD